MHKSNRFSSMRSKRCKYELFTGSFMDKFGRGYGRPPICGKEGSHISASSLLGGSEGGQTRHWPDWWGGCKCAVRAAADGMQRNIIVESNFDGRDGVHKC